MSVEEIKVGKKRPTAYIQAGEYGLNKEGEIKLMARGNNIPRAIIVGETLKEKFRKAKYSVCLGLEEKEGKLVPTIEISVIL